MRSLCFSVFGLPNCNRGLFGPFQSEWQLLQQRTERLTAPLVQQFTRRLFADDVWDHTEQAS